MAYACGLVITIQIYKRLKLNFISDNTICVSIPFKQYSKLNYKTNSIIPFSSFPWLCSRLYKLLPNPPLIFIYMCTCRFSVSASTLRRESHRVKEDSSRDYQGEWSRTTEGNDEEREDFYNMSSQWKKIFNSGNSSLFCWLIIELVLRLKESRSDFVLSVYLKF